MRGLRDGSLSIRKDVEAALHAIEQFGAMFGWGLAARIHNFANEWAADAKLPIHLMPVDLEYAMLVAALQTLLHKINSVLGTFFTTEMDMLARLGSKAAPKSSTFTKGHGYVVRSRWRVPLTSVNFSGAGLTGRRDAVTDLCAP
ncbi:MAG: hypothetical protein JWQ39_1601 [Glaciihabitans sp.]|nr:hypothetical protein [Glaciihabitans sp.]